MSIILKGIELPKDIGDIISINLYDKKDNWLDNIEVDRKDIIEIPTPHGRLIDDVKKIIAQIEPCMLIATTYDEQVKRAEAVKEWLLSILEAEE